MFGRLGGTDRALRGTALVIAVSLSIAGCGESTTEIRGAEVSAYLAQVAVDGITATLVQSQPPLAGAGPTVTAPSNNSVITGGSLQVEVSSSEPFQTVALYVPGSNGYHLVNLSSLVTSATVVITVGSLLPTLDFQYQILVAGADGVFGPAHTTNVSAMEVISGDIQVSVTWNTIADVDLHVVTPTGEEIYYGHRASPTGGQLDIDANAACSTSEIFQENIGWPAGTAPSGEYIVRVDYWSACGVLETDFIVTVSLRPGVPVTPITPGSRLQTFQGSFSGEGTGGGAGDGTTITSFIF